MITIRLVLLAIICLPLCNQGLMAQALKWEKNYLSGKKAFEEGQYETAVKHSSKAVEFYYQEIGERDTAYVELLKNLGIVYVRVGVYSKAIESYEEALIVIDSLRGTENCYYAGLIATLAHAKHRNREEKTALVLFEQALNTLKRYCPTSDEYLSMLHNFAIYYSETGNKKMALNTALSTLKLKEKHLEKDDLSIGQTSVLIGRVYSDLGQYEKAIRHLRFAVGQMRKKVGEEHPSYANAIRELAKLLHRHNQYQEAEAFFRKAINIYKSSEYYNGVRLLHTYNDLGVMMGNQGRWDQAVRWLEKSNSLQRELFKATPGKLVTNTTNLAYAYLKVGWIDKSEALLNMALDWSQMYPEDVSLRSYINLLSMLGGLYNESGRKHEALPFYQQVLDSSRLIFAKNHPKYTAHLRTLGSIYLGLGQADKAKHYLEQAHQLILTKDEKDFINYIRIKGALGSWYYNQGEYKEALEYYLKSLELSKRFQSTDYAALGSLHSNIGYTFKAMRNNLLAKEHLQQALKYTRKAFNRKHPNMANRYLGLGHLNQLQKQHKKAYKYYRKAHSNVLQYSGYQHPAQIETLYRLGEILVEQGRPNKAFSYFQELNNHLSDRIQSGVKILSSEEKENFLEYNRHIYHRYWSFLMDHLLKEPEASEAFYNDLLEVKGLILENSQIVMRGLEQAEDTILVAQFQELRDNQQLLAKQYTLLPKNRISALDSIELATDNLESTLVRNSRQYREAFQTRTWQEVRHLLEGDEVAIEFIHFKDYESSNSNRIRYCALILRNSWPSPVMIPLFEQSELDSLLVIPDPERPPPTRLRVQELYNTRLYDLIWKPLTPYLDSIKTVYLTPSGDLNQLSFSAIPDDKGILLADMFDLRYLTSSRNIISSKQQRMQVGSIHLWGGLIYDETPEFSQNSRQLNSGRVTGKLNLVGQRSSNQRELIYLPGTLAEVVRISSIFDKKGIPVSVISGKRGGEERFKTLGKNQESPSILHLATHGFFLPRTREVSDSTQSDISGAFQILRYVENPLFRAGLHLSGAQAAWAGNSDEVMTIEDNILTAFEVSNMNLSNTELVVLSACETGLGENSDSEGVYGLQRAFKLAGVKRMLVTLWKVDDEVTGEFMESFYQHLIAGKSTRQSFYEAQQSLRQTHSSPYYWAGFVLTE